MSAACANGETLTHVDLFAGLVSCSHASCPHEKSYPFSCCLGKAAQPAEANATTWRFSASPAKVSACKCISCQCKQQQFVLFRGHVAIFARECLCCFSTMQPGTSRVCDTSRAHVCSDALRLRFLRNNLRMLTKNTGDPASFPSYDDLRKVNGQEYPAEEYGQQFFTLTAAAGSSNAGYFS
jgi:hypothetical protein